MSEKTVAAISTPLGVGGIGVIRISGENAIGVADLCFKSFSGKLLTSLKGYTAAYGNVINEKGAVIDDAVALVFREPKSYTGEDVVELSVHGGIEVTREVLRRVYECGALPAGPGEFTRRAFLNGKTDLSKAESIMEIISAENASALAVSRGAKGGNIERAVTEICDLLIELAANISAYSDYPDEDLEELSEENFLNLLKKAKQKTDTLISTYDSGKVLRNGIDCAIVGKPNVGKSTLMNLLAGQSRSIVTDVAGTTRDIIETTVNLGELTLNLADTAGIHETADTVESAGVKLALDKMDSSGVILCVFDGSRPEDPDDLKLLEAIKGKRAVIIINKTDLAQKFDTKILGDNDVVEISAKQGDGKEKLQEAIFKTCNILHLSENDTVLVSERQYSCALRALNAINSAMDTMLSGMTVDAVGVCVDDAIAALLELTGKRVTNEVADEVFRRFCVGK